MAINRGPFNALVDDDGTGLTGSVWNKAAIQAVILDPADAAYGGKYDTVVTTAATGTVTAWAPGLNGHTFLNWTGNADLALHGLAGGVTGQRVTIRNSGAGVITVAHVSASAASGQKFANTVSSGPTPIGLTGFATWIYDGTYWTLIAHEQASWIAVPFAAGNFTGVGGTTWTVTAGGVPTNRYRLAGRTLQWQLSVNATFTGSGSQLRIVIPNGWNAAAGTFYGAFGVLQPPATAGYYGANFGGPTLLDLFRADGSVFSGGTAGAFGSALFEIL